MKTYTKRMETLRNLSGSIKTLVIASGAVLSSIGVYLLYRKLTQHRSASSENVSDDTLMYKRQPCENTDDSDVSLANLGKKVLVLGLEKSGKSCLLAAMTNDETQRPYKPTLGFNAVCITNIGERLDIMEIGGSQRYREHWGKFLGDTSILLYVIDSNAPEALSPALNALKDILTDKALEKVPVVIVFSKKDCNTAIPTQELISFIKKEQLGDEIYQYIDIQVKCGGAHTTHGVTQLQDVLVELARNV